MRLRVATAVVMCTAWFAILGGRSPPPVFRAGAESVAVNVAVTRANAAASGLTAADFRLYDNDVPQRVAAVAQDEVPLDVSFVINFSGGVPQTLDPREALGRMASFLRPSDRFRVLTMGHSVVNTVPWQSAGSLDISGMQYVTGHVRYLSDSVLAGLLHRADPDRRHLVVAVTPGDDLCSITSGETLLRVAERSGSVFHWVDTPMGPSTRDYVKRSDGVEYVCRNAAASPLDLGSVLSDVANLTGGRVHTARSQTAVNRSDAFFDTILDDFRRSYVLYYEPVGVPRGGWHRLRVELPGHKGYSLRTRTGYWGADTLSNPR